MKKTVLLFTISFFLFGCNMSPNKEARIQKLETEVQEALNNIKQLESRIQTLETEKEQLRIRVLELEKR